MIRPSLAYPRSTLDAPAPHCLAKVPELADVWGQCLVSACRYGKLEDLSRGTVLDKHSGDFSLVIRGCVIVTASPLPNTVSPMFVTALQRGDIITPTTNQLFPITMTVRSPSTLLHVSKADIHNFATDLGLSDKLYMAVNAEMTRLYAAAAQLALRKDQDRILRVIESLALHEDAVITAMGNEVEVSKDEIRTLAGVQKRSATRAFQNLEAAGLVSFHGYKRICYKGHRQQ